MKKLLLLLTVSFVTGSACSNINIWKTNINTVQKTNSYHNLYVLGDSLSDSGSFAGAMSAMRKFLTFNFLGFTMTDPCYKNRTFSNGPVEVEYLAKALNLSLTPGWDFNLIPNHINFSQVGNNYAVGGSQASEGDTLYNKLITNRFRLQFQYEALIKQHKLQADDLVFVDSGNNDLLSYLDSTSLTYDQKIKNAINAADCEANVVKELLQQGVKHVMVGNALDLALTPKYRLTQPHEAENLVNYFNTEWTKEISDVATQFSWQDIKPVDLNAIFKYLLEAFKALDPANDIENATLGESYWKILVGKFYTYYMPNKNVDSLKHDFFFDNLHPTAWVHEQVGKFLTSYALNWDQNIAKETINGHWW